MFSRDRYSLSRFSLGSEDSRIQIEATFTEELKQLSGVAIPVETTAFFNDVLRSSLRGAIAMKASFDSTCSLLASCTMNANIDFVSLLCESMYASICGSQNGNIVTAIIDSLECAAHAGKTMPFAAALSDALLADVYGVKNIKIFAVVSDALTSIMDAQIRATEVVRIDITVPPESEIRIDSETYRALLDGENILYAQNGDWLMLSRELLYVDIESASGGVLAGTMIYTERYL